jgi:hypothetical protein
MTSDDFRELCVEMINWLLTQGCERSLSFAAMAIDGLTTIGSSETITDAVQHLVTIDATSGPVAMYLLPINVLFVEPNATVAYGLIDSSAAVSCRV